MIEFIMRMWLQSFFAMWMAQIYLKAFLSFLVISCNALQFAISPYQHIDSTFGACLLRDTQTIVFVPLLYELNLPFL